MRIPRLLLERILLWLGVLIASLLILVWGAPAAAQANHPPQPGPSAAQLRQQILQAQPQLSDIPPAMSRERCYTVREYQFERTDPSSDATRFKDSVSCEPASQFHARTAIATPVLHGASAPSVRPSPLLPRCGFLYGNVCPAVGPAGGKPITR